MNKNWIFTLLLFNDVALDCLRLGLWFSSRINSFSFSFVSIASNSFRLFSLLFIDTRLRIVVSVDKLDCTVRFIDDVERASSSVDDIASTWVQTIKKIHIRSFQINQIKLLSFCPWLLSSISDSSILFCSFDIVLVILFCSSSRSTTVILVVSGTIGIDIWCCCCCDWLFCSFEFIESRCCCRDVFNWLVRRGRCWNNVLAFIESFRSITRSNLIHSSWLNNEKNE